MRGEQMSWKQEWLERYYRSKPGWKDGTTQFHELCRAYAPVGSKVLEIGAGPTNPTSALLASLGELHGVDVSPEVSGNVHLRSSAVVGPDEPYPFESDTFDLAVSNYVVEHVANPTVHLREIHRVLKTGGHYLFRTPNLRHYVALASRATSFRVHRLLANRLRDLPSDTHEPWPTVYAMNTAAAVRRHAVGEQDRLSRRLARLFQRGDPP